MKNLNSYRKNNYRTNMAVLRVNQKYDKINYQKNYSIFKVSQFFFWKNLKKRLLFILLFLSNFIQD